MTNAKLFAFLFDPPRAQAEEILARWLLQSRRFQAFAVEYKTKIRKKLRLAQTQESLQSLLLELNIARRLVEDLRCRVEYEKYGQGGERNPDLTITFRARICFNLEATCVQMASLSAEGRIEKLIRIVCEKMGQSVPHMLNCLVIAAENGLMTADEVSAAMKSLKRRVEQREGELLARVRFDNPSEFYKQFQWLNGIVFCGLAGQGDSPGTILYTNPQSRYPLPPDIHALLQTTLSLKEPGADRTENSDARRKTLYREQFL